MSGENGPRRSHQAAAIEKSPHRREKRKKRRPWRLLLTLALLAALVYLLPAILVHSPLLGWVVNKAAADLNGTVSIGTVARAGWFSPITIAGVEVKDANGKTILLIHAAHSEKTPAEMIWNRADLGRFYVESPKLALVLRDDGSNVEDLLAKYLVPKDEELPEDEKPSAGIGFALLIKNAAVTVADQASGRTWKVDKLSLEVAMSGDGSGAIAAKFVAELPDAQPPGKLDGEARIDGGAGEAAVGAANVPLAMFRPLLARFAPGVTLTGLFSTTARAKWDDRAAGANRLTADLNLGAFSLAAPFLQTDVVELERVHAVCEAAWTAEGLEIEKTTLDCDVGSIFAKGTVPLDNEGGVAVDSLLNRRQEFDGRLDLARLARLLPATLHLRQGMRIDSGQVRLTANGRPETQGMVWQGELNAADLVAQIGGRRIAWQQPIRATLQARDTPQGPAVDSLGCESDFLKLHAAGTADQFAGSFSFSLGRLAEQLAQFVDLGGLLFAGEGTGGLNWTRTPQRQFTAGAEVRISDFQLATAGKQAWIEPSVSAKFSAGGQMDPGGGKIDRLDSAALSVITAADQIDARLTGRVAGPAGGGQWPVLLKMQGQLQNWPPRLEPWMSIGDWRVGGTYTLEADATASTTAAELRQFKLSTGRLTVASKSFNADESVLDVSAVGSWDGQQRRVQIQRASLGCDTVAFVADGVLVSMPENGPLEMAGSINYQTFLGRLKQWFADPKKPSSWKLAGQLKGSAQLQHAGENISGSTNAEILNLAVTDSSGQKFQEPVVKLSAAGDYDGRSKVLQLGKFELTSSALAAAAAGRSGPVGDHTEAQIDGRLRYDLERIAGLLGPYLGSGVRIAGRGESPFQYRGPLGLVAGSAAAGIKWDGANVYGFQIGPGELKAAMGDGAVRIEPLDLAVSRGRMRVAPRVRLTPEPVELTLPAGPLMENIQIDPAMCSTLLMYIAPVLADVTSAQGSFSIALDGCRVPLADPKKSDLAGRFVIHSVQVGPGPLIREMAVLLGRESPARLRQESVVAFQMKNGRVYHNNLEMIFPDLTVRTQGSVGLDQTLDLTAEMPVPPKWLANNPLASKALANQVIRIPLKGTLKKPQLDRREMERLSREFIKKAAGNLLENELNKLPGELDRLLGPRKK